MWYVMGEWGLTIFGAGVWVKDGFDEELGLLVRFVGSGLWILWRGEKKFRKYAMAFLFVRNLLLLPLSLRKSCSIRSAKRLVARGGSSSSGKVGGIMKSRLWNNQGSSRGCCSE